MENGDDQGEQVGEFVIEKQIGTGAAGVVYKAKHRDSGEAVALKLLHAQVSEDADLQNRFVREMSVMQKFDHSNIVAHRDCGIHDGKLFLAMEFVDRGTLAEVLRKRGTLSWRSATKAAIQICRALAHAHEHGVVHRDLKPANLFLSTDGHVKVGDFGLARDLDQRRLTVDGQTVGTCRYMAPEQVQGQADLTGAVDLYAVGCLMFQMLTGKPPFDGATIIEIFEKHLFNPAPSIKSIVPDVPQDLDTVISRLLEKNPKDRPASASEATAMFQAVLKGEPLPEAALANEPPQGSPAESLPTEHKIQPAPRKPNTIFAAIFVGAVIAGGTIAWLLLSG